MASIPRCGVYYVPEAYGHRTRDIVGRQSAGRELLRAYACAHRDRGYYCVADSTAEFSLFRAQIAELGGDPANTYHIASNDPYAIARLGTLYWPDPAIGRIAWARRALRDDAYSVCGVTHTLSESGVIRGIQDLLVAPVHDWDALICTSVAARKAVEGILAQWSAYLEERMGAAGRISLQLPVIPLGVDARRFRRTEARRAEGAALRLRLGIPADAVVCLYFGRFNFLTKSHPTPMFIAAEQAAAKARDIDLRLLMVGQFSNPVVESEFRSLAQGYGGRVPIHWVDGDDVAQACASWHAADFFISLSDNMQETFGMTLESASNVSVDEYLSYIGCAGYRAYELGMQGRLSHQLTRWPYLMHDIVNVVLIPSERSVQDL